MLEKTKYKKKATRKQLVALELITQGHSGKQAMLKAGYSESTASNVGSKLLKSNAIVTLIDKMQLQLGKENITTGYLVTKLKEWIDASDPVVIMAGPVKDVDGNILRKADYKTQLAAYDRIADIYGLKPSANDASKLKRKITLEEYMDDDNLSKDNGIGKSSEVSTN